MPLTPIDVIDVTKSPYNAMGNGVADDTNAIKAAIQDLTHMSILPPETGVTLRTSPTLYFPAGIYNISSELQLTFLAKPMGCVKVLGENAIIRPNPDKPFTGDYAFRAYDCEDFRLINLNFINFDKAVRLENDNANSMQVIVEECGFFGNKVALEMLCQSTLTVIEKCKFFENTKAIHLFRGDKVVVKDCWIESGTMSDSIVADVKVTHPAQIENHAYLTLTDCVLVPHPPVDATEPAWINNYNSVRVQGTRQGGEKGSFTLINNFAGSVLPISEKGDATSISVKDSQCYAVYNNNHDASPKIIHPAIVRYVTKIPNSTVIRNNVGLIDCRLIDFSYELYYKPGHTPNIADVFTNSGAAYAPHSYIEVANNAGGVLYDHNSYVPLPLYPLIRNDESIWPAQPHNDLAMVGNPVISSINDTNDTVEYTFDYEDNLDVTHLLNYTGNPNSGGSGWYSGGFTGLLRANGYTSPNAPSGLKKILLLEQLFNRFGGLSSGDYPAGTFSVAVYWQATGTEFLPYGEVNHKFCVRITSLINGGNVGSIKITPLNAL